MSISDFLSKTNRLRLSLTGVCCVVEKINCRIQVDYIGINLITLITARPGLYLLKKLQTVTLACQFVSKVVI